MPARWLTACVVAAWLLAPAAARADSTAARGERALSIANHTAAVESARRHGPVQVFPSSADGIHWRMRYTRDGHAVVEVDVDASTRRVEAVWTGAKTDFPMARGYPGWFGGHVTAPWVWLPLCAVFLLVFANRRKPLSLGNLDLLVLVAGFGLSQWFFQRGQIGLSVPLAYPPLLYLLVRMVLIGLGRARPGVVMTNARTPALALLLVVLCAARIALNVADHNNHDYVGWGKPGTTVVDVGLAGVVGANRLQHGLPLYTPTAHMDTYGPLNYVAYLPFELIWPYDGHWTSVPAAHAAAIAFDLLTIAGLVALGLSLRPGRRDWRLGLALALAWTACPYSTYVLNANSNDALPAAGVVWALVALRWAPARGFLIGAATAVKLVPAALLPAALRLRGERRIAPAVAAGAAFALVLVACAIAFAPPQGVSLLWSHTVARQDNWYSPFSVWGMWRSTAWLRRAGQVLLLLAAAAVALRRQRGVTQVAALGAALLIGVELTALHWIYFYVVWFLPLLLAALLIGPEPSGRTERLELAPE